ncbi:uncharacterized protein DUF4129 [Nocardioides sp. J9]|uniref:DUF4129 domain-containing protein n=1 Tax=Nocardioides sp. J9 TaxID=935844 RepID=UPI0011A8ED08|nr:DUF4129 domain-containing protein [Nocardioides sp. J9]TWG99774.1 uncharacterized protein DUF4129 [Nocardioides sp. J9]
MTPLAALLAGSLEPPLDPSGDEARRSLRRELADPKYYDTDLLQRLRDWLERTVGRTIEGVSGSRPLSALLAILVAMALVAAVILIVSRARRTARAGRRPAAALTDEMITAAELRARAEAALAAGDSSAALVDAFRALAVRQVERHRIEDVPQATAHELARALAAEFPAHAGAVHHGADLFDQTLYGEREATPGQARELLDLDDALAGRAVRR